MEPQVEEEGRREIRDKQRPWSNRHRAVPRWGRALVAAPGIRLCGRPAATVPSPVPLLCSQGQVCALSPGAPCLLNGRHSSLHLFWDCQGRQALIGPQNC